MGLFERTLKAHCDWKERWYPGKVVRQAALALERQHMPTAVDAVRFCERLAECQCVQGCLQSVINLD